MSNFRDFYKGHTVEYREDEYTFKVLKRQITSYLKESSLERLHGIFNKLYLLRKKFTKEEFYTILLEDMKSEDKKRFMQFLLSEGFEHPNREVNPEGIWQHQLNIILNRYKKGGNMDILKKIDGILNEESNKWDILPVAKRKELLKTAFHNEMEEKDFDILSKEKWNNLADWMKDSLIKIL